MNPSKSGVVRRAFLAGLVAALALLTFYFLLVGLTSRSWEHSLELFIQDRYYVTAIAAGFGVQLGLFSYVRQLRRVVRTRAAGAVAASGTGTSTVSMVACCVHHLADILPVIGASGAAIFLEQYRYPVMGAGIAVNILGIGLMVRLIAQNGLWPSYIWASAGRKVRKGEGDAN